MQKSELKKRVADIRAYLESVGTPISSNSAHEIVARALGLKNKHVLKASLNDSVMKTEAPVKSVDFIEIEIDGEAVPVRAANAAPYSVDELRAADWHVSAIICVPLDVLAESIDRLNEFVSKQLVGNDSALCDINYQHLADKLYPAGCVAMRVTGYVEDPAYFFQEETESDKVFYRDLAEFYALLEGNTELDATYRVEVHVKGTEGTGPVFNICHTDKSQLSLLQEYARSHGANNEEVDALEDSVLLNLETSPGQNRQCMLFSADDLKYVAKLNSNDWLVEGFVFSKCSKV